MASRIFLSAVSNEFAGARDALANRLQSRGVQVAVQRSFRNDGKAGTLLEKLRRYIEGCDLVVCLMGAQSGVGFPWTPMEDRNHFLAEALNDILLEGTPKPIVLPYPSLGALFKGRAGCLARLRASLTRAGGRVDFGARQH